jgi:hypothetical protein
MADLLDIAPSTAVEVVWIDGRRVSVRGVSVDAIASIVARFPEVRSLISGGVGDSLVPRLIEGCAAAVGPIIAAGCGHLADAIYEQHAAKLLPEYQLKFLTAIFRLTFPNGIGSFVEALTGLIAGTGEGAKPIKVRSRKSPSPSLPSAGAQGSAPILQ